MGRMSNAGEDDDKLRVGCCTSSVVGSKRRIPFDRPNLLKEWTPTRPQVHIDTEFPDLEAIPPHLQPRWPIQQLLFSDEVNSLSQLRVRLVD